VVRALVQWVVRPMARRLGRKHVKEAQLPLADTNAIARAASMSYWHRMSIGGNFESSYGVAWQELGAQDAQEGMSRATVYRNHSYNLGWRQEVLHLNAGGWLNQRMGTQLDLMERLYWAKVREGNEAEYYESSTEAPLPSTQGATASDDPPSTSW
jgi:hypothetical protein